MKKLLILACLVSVPASAETAYERIMAFYQNATLPENDQLTIDQVWDGSCVSSTSQDAMIPSRFVTVENNDPIFGGPGYYPVISADTSWSAAEEVSYAHNYVRDGANVVQAFYIDEEYQAFVSTETSFYNSQEGQMTRGKTYYLRTTRDANGNLQVALFIGYDVQEASDVCYFTEVLY